MSNSVLHLFTFLCHIYAPLYCSFARKKPLLSTTTREVFFMHLGAKQPSIQENTAETGVGTVDQTAPAPVYCFSAVKQAQYFSRFFAQQRSWQNSTRRDSNTFSYPLPQQKVMQPIQSVDLNPTILDTIATMCDIEYIGKKSPDFVQIPYPEWVVRQFRNKLR